MPLTRDETREPQTDFLGSAVQFDMQDGKQRIRCLITYGALDDLEGDNINRDTERLARFNLYRDYIERIASRAYEAGGLREGFVLVDANMVTRQR